MKWLGWGILAFISITSILVQPVNAVIETLPSNEVPIKVNGPLLITGYSFSGHTVNYIQVYNSSTSVVNLEGWKLGYDYASTKYNLIELAGKLAPKNYITVASNAIMPTATFTFVNVSPPADPVLTSISLIPPSALNFNDEVATPSISSSTPRIAGVPATFYFTRTTSSSTGSYNTTYNAFIPPFNFTLASDGLYEPPIDAEVMVVEIYPDAPACAPTEIAGCNDYVKLFNNSSQSVDLSRFRLRAGSYGQSATSSNTAQLTGTLAAGNYASFPITLSSSGSWVWLEDTYGTVRYDSSIVGYPSSSGHDGEAWSYNRLNSTWAWTVYPQPGNVENQFIIPTEVNTCSGLIISEVAANVASEDQFIEILNTNSADLNLEGCMIQTNRSTTNSHVLTGNLVSGGVRVIYIKDTPLTLTKTTSGTVYLLSSDQQTEIDSVSYEDMAENTSMALVGDTWVQTYYITPNSANIWLEYLPCDDGYFRNLETGYCNKVQVNEEQVDCEVGKYRNPETNRCTNVETVNSLLAPCASNQVRNPETNRCRAVSTAGSLKPCAANQERNPETNRCRNKVDMVQADFPVEVVGESAQSTLGWWAFGGVGLLALGYAGWEWRIEIMNAIKKVGSFIPSRG